jgi:hypothetical protein
MAAFLILLLFAGPTVHPAQPGEMQPVGNYVLSPEGVFPIDKGKVLRAPKDFHPAFVFLSELMIKPAKKNDVSVLSADAKSIQVQYSDGVPIRKGTATTLTAIYEIESVFAVTESASSEKYLLIRWQGDTSSCAVAFTLFQINSNTLEEAGTNAYQCDL